MKLGRLATLCYHASFVGGYLSQAVPVMGLALVIESQWPQVAIKVLFLVMTQVLLPKQQSLLVKRNESLEIS
ncbi:hypothetical protein F0562_012408 [Nyssa sinensis]|uniref:Uncharacterized protein n=1 Tax=Nyssa sinensis TaxID=561372 RepID=A0A5J4ZSM6_9ASTE|nr:hypothetical protein F0562_012408 [Nyssa sinensis]